VRACQRRIVDQIRPVSQIGLVIAEDDMWLRVVLRGKKEMLGWVKCGACGKQFRPRRSERTDVCPDCGRAQLQQRLIGDTLRGLGTSELDAAESKVREAQLQEATELVDGISSMETNVAQWQQLNRILNDPSGALSASERKEYKALHKRLAKSEAVRAFLRESEEQMKRERKRTD